MREYMDDEIYEEKKYVVLIIYDISDNQQRFKVAKYLSGYGIRVQKSAFEARLNKGLFTSMEKGLDLILKPEDNVRIYRLQGYEEIKVFGSKNYMSDEDVIIVQENEKNRLKPPFLRFTRYCEWYIIRAFRSCYRRGDAALG